MQTTMGPLDEERTVIVDAAGTPLVGTLGVPPGAMGIVVFAHGSGSSRHSGRNRFVAQVLRNAGIGTLLFDLLTPAEAIEDQQTAHLRFDVDLLARRLTGATDWLLADPDLADLPLGYFGSSTGACAALLAAEARPEVVRAVVSRGGRPDLAGEALPRVQAPTLLIVGGDDEPVVASNQAAERRMRGHVVLEVVPGAGHLFEEPGAIDQVAHLAKGWFTRFLRPIAAPRATS